MKGIPHHKISFKGFTIALLLNISKIIVPLFTLFKIIVVLFILLPYYHYLSLYSIITL